MFSTLYNIKKHILKTRSEESQDKYGIFWKETQPDTNWDLAIFTMYLNGTASQVANVYSAESR